MTEEKPLPTYTLGLSGTQDALLDSHLWSNGIFDGHDAAAVLLCDGEIVAAIEEERLNRIKHTNRFPSRAILACLEIAGITLRDVARIGWYYSAGHDDDKFLRLASSRNLAAPSVRELLATRLEELSGIPKEDLVETVSFVSHHVCHLYSAALPAPFSGPSLVLSLDAYGGQCSGMVAAFGRISTRCAYREIPVSSSAGPLLYASGCGMIPRYGPFDEYKFMGLLHPTEIPRSTERQWVSPSSSCRKVSSRSRSFAWRCAGSSGELLATKARWRPLRRHTRIGLPPINKQLGKNSHGHTSSSISGKPRGARSTHVRRRRGSQLHDERRDRPLRSVQ